MVAVGLCPTLVNQSLPSSSLATKRTAADRRSSPTLYLLLWCRVAPQPSSPDASSAGVRATVALDLPSLRGGHRWARLGLTNPPVRRASSGMAVVAGTGVHRAPDPSASTDARSTPRLPATSHADAARPRGSVPTAGRRRQAEQRRRRARPAPSSVSRREEEEGDMRERESPVGPGCK